MNSKNKLRSRITKSKTFKCICIRGRRLGNWKFSLLLYRLRHTAQATVVNCYQYNSTHAIGKQVFSWPSSPQILYYNWMNILYRFYRGLLHDDVVFHTGLDWHTKWGQGAESAIGSSSGVAGEEGQQAIGVFEQENRLSSNWLTLFVAIYI